MGDLARASALDLFAQDVDEIVNHAKIPERNDPQADRLNILRNWLRREKSGHWLLIVDNIDDIDTKSGTTARGFIESLSGCTQGWVVITTRSDSVAFALMDRDEILHVEPMDHREARTLLCQKLGHGYKDIVNISRLADALNGIPLALAQAAAYISRSESMPVSEYLNLMQSDDCPLLEDLDHHSFRRDRASTNAIYLTWQISFKAIRRIKPTATNLLSLMSFFHHQAIPVSALRPVPCDCDEKQGQPVDQREAQSAGPGDRALKGDILVLQEYRLLSATADNTAMFDMHALVQRATQLWLEGEKQFDHWRYCLSYQ